MCLVGAHIYAKTTFLIFVIVIVVLITVFISFFAVHPQSITLPDLKPNATGPTTANFTGFKLETLLGNVWGKLEDCWVKKYKKNYTTMLV